MILYKVIEKSAVKGSKSEADNVLVNLQKVKTPPPLIEQWKAHDSPIVSVEYISHDTGEYVLTASTDRTARLWSTQGHWVGTFGQVKS
jgi:WD40 repeat protein